MCVCVSLSLSLYLCVQITARAEGQVSLLLKRNGCIAYTTKSKCTDPSKENTDSELLPECSRITVQEPSVDQRVDPPIGTVYPRNSSRTEVEYLKRAKVSASCTDARQYISKTTQAVKKEPSRQDSLRQESFGQELLKQEVVREESGGAVGNDMGSVMTCSDKIAKWNALGEIRTYDIRFDPVVEVRMSVSMGVCVFVCVVTFRII